MGKNDTLTTCEIAKVYETFLIKYDLDIHNDTIRLSRMRGWTSLPYREFIEKYRTEKKVYEQYCQVDLY